MKTKINERGDGNLYTIFVTLFLFMLLSVMTTWICVGANVAHIRNAVRDELAAVAIRIEADTYQALREGNLDAYKERLSSSTAYHDAIKQMVKDNIRQNIDLANNHYEIKNIALSFCRNAEDIEYILSCDINFVVNIIGYQGIVQTETLSFSGHHALK